METDLLRAESRVPRSQADRGWNTEMRRETLKGMVGGFNRLLV